MRARSFSGLICLAFSIAAIGCGDNGTTSTTGGTGSGGGGGSKPAGVCDGKDKVTCVAMVDDYTVNATPTKAPRDLSQYASISLLAADGSGKSTTGKTFDDGHVEFATVPTGSYLVSLTHTPDPRFPKEAGLVEIYQLSGSAIDLGKRYVERGDTDATVKGKSLEVQGSLSSTWDAPAGGAFPQDSLLLASAEAGSYGAITQNPGPSDGDSKVDLTVDDTAVVHQIDSTKGDQTELVRERTSLIAPTGSTPVKGWANSPVTVALDAATSKSFDLGPLGGSFSGTLAAVKASGKLDLRYDADGFAAIYQKATGGFPTGISAGLNILLEPAKSDVSSSVRPSLLSVVAGDATPKNPSCFPDSDGKCDTGKCPSGCDPTTTFDYPGSFDYSFSYANPFSTEGTEIAELHYGFSYSYVNPIDKSGGGLTGEVVVSAPVKSLSGKVVTSPLGLVSNIEIGGKVAPLDKTLDGIGTFSTIDWTKPPGGTSIRYRIEVLDLTKLTDADGVSLDQRIVATYSVGPSTDTTLTATLPEGTLQKGRAYYIRVVAISDGTATDPSAPNRQLGTDHSYTSAPTGILLP